MRVGIIQPNYIPWRGYFDFIDDVDRFVFYDDVVMGYGKKWRNRNLIKTPRGHQWLTVPLRHGQGALPIHQVAIDYTTNWIDRHLNLLHASYRRAPAWDVYQGAFSDILHRRYEFIADLNVELCLWIMSALGITTVTCRARDFGVPACEKGTRPLRFVELLEANTYLSGPSSLPYTDVDAYQRRGICLEIKAYDYPADPHPGGAFDGGLSILDLLFSVGEGAKHYLKSMTPNRILLTGQNG
jgi:hypothetical protein